MHPTTETLALPCSFPRGLDSYFSEICSLFTSGDKESLVKLYFRVVSRSGALGCRTRVDLERNRTGDQSESGEEDKTGEPLYSFSFTPGTWPLA